MSIYTSSNNLILKLKLTFCLHNKKTSSTECCGQPCSDLKLYPYQPEAQLQSIHLVRASTS